MDIYRMEAEAKDRMVDNLPMDFVIVGATNRLKAKWLDPYLGFLKIEGQDGFVTTKSIADFGSLVSVEWAS